MLSSVILDNAFKLKLPALINEGSHHNKNVFLIWLFSRSDVLRFYGLISIWIGNQHWSYLFWLYTFDLKGDLQQINVIRHTRFLKIIIEYSTSHDRGDFESNLHSKFAQHSKGRFMNALHQLTISWKHQMVNYKLEERTEEGKSERYVKFIYF